MEKIALYRKYRPKTFDEIYDQSAITKTLISAIDSNCLTHSYIFAGNKGSGKTSIAKIFSKAINCLNPINANPCNQCENCKAIDSNSSTDFFELDAASNSGVAEIRSLIDSISYYPSQLKYKVYIIDEAHMLTNNSWNALLKTIEEPPAHVIFIFATTEYHKIPATIISRCQRYDFHKIKFESIVELIKAIATTEKIQIDDEAVKVIAKLADGAARDALTILDQLAGYSSKKISTDIVNEIFGLINVDKKIELLNYIHDKKTEKMINMIDDLSDRSINFNNLIMDIIEIYMDKLVFEQTKNNKLLKVLTQQNVNRLANKNINQLINLINIFSNNLMKIKNSSNPKFIFEYTCFLAMNPTNQEIIQPNLNLYNANQKVSTTADTSVTNISNVKSTTEQPTSIVSKTLVEQKNESRKNLWDENPYFNKNDETIKSSNQNTEKGENEIENDLTPLINETTFIIEEIKQNKKMPLKSTEPLSNNLKNETSNTIIPTKSIVKKEKNEKDNSLSAENSFQDNLFDNHTIQFSELYKDNMDEEEFKQTFFSIASNHESKIKDKFNQILDNLKEFTSVYSPTINNFVSADRFLITSKNGAVMLFESDAEANRFNKISETEEFYRFFLESFKEKRLVIGVSKEKAKKYRDEYQKLNKKEFKDVKIKNDNLDTKTKLLDILNDFEEGDS